MRKGPFGLISGIRTSEYTENTKFISAVNFRPGNEKYLIRLFIEKLEKLFLAYQKEYGTPDLLHAHTCPWAGVAAAEISAKYGIPFVITEHSSGFNRGLYSEFAIEKIADAYKKASGVIAVSKMLGEHIERISGVRTEIIPNMIKDSFFAINRTAANKFNLITVAGLQQVKGLDILINAFAKAKLQNPELKLVIVGEGPERTKLEQLISALKLTNCVSLLGQLSSEEIVNQLKKSGVFISSSHTETFGVALAEGIASGIPVIATRSGGPEGFVTDQNGILVEKNDIDALSKAILWILENYSNFDQKRIKESIRHFSGNIIAEQLLSIYKNVVNSNR